MIFLNVIQRLNEIIEKKNRRKEKELRNQVIIKKEVS